MADPLPTTAELLLQWDAQRPRTQQAELGMSDLGGCRRKAGYHLAGYPLDNRRGSIQAVMGTSVHETVRQQLMRMRADGILPGDALIEQEVHYGGVKGHLDLYVPPRCRDTKTVGHTNMLDRYRYDGPPRRHIWQIHAYAAALILMGYQVTEVQLDYLARDSGETWMWSAPFDVGYVRDAFGWLANVRDTPLDVLARDYAPDSAMCKSCPFLGACWEDHAVEDRDLTSALFVEDPDAAKWATRLDEARAARKAAEEEEKRARGALDALRPNTEGRAEVEIPGFDRLIRFTVSAGRKTLDREQAEADYRAAGGEPPMAVGDPVVKVELVPPPGAEGKKGRRKRLA